MSIENFGGRKFILSILAFITIFVLTLTGGLNADQFLDAIKWIIGLFVVGNVGAYVATKEQPENNP